MITFVQVILMFNLVTCTCPRCHNDGNARYGKHTLWFVQVIPVINKVRDLPMFSMVMISQDWHCEDHISFASQHQDKSVYDVIDLLYDDQGTEV